MSQKKNGEGRFLPYDLFHIILPHLDTHVIYALLSSSRIMHGVYDEESIIRAQYNVLQGSKLYTELIHLVSKLFTGEERTRKVAEYQNKQEEGAEKISAAMKNPTVMHYYNSVATSEGREKLQRMGREKTLHTQGMDAFGMSAKALEDLLAFAQEIYTYGRYPECRELLRFIRSLDPSRFRSNETVSWGLLLCEILCAQNRLGSGKWQDAINTLHVLQDNLDFSKLELGTYFAALHYALIPCLALETSLGREKLLELYLSERYLGVICAHAPYLLRYAIVALLTTKLARGRGQNVRNLPWMRDLIYAFEYGEFYQDYTDPILTCFKKLYVDCDFFTLPALLGPMEEILFADPFTQLHAVETLAVTRRQIMEDLCRVYSAVPLSFVSDQLGIEPEDVEKWVMGVLRIGNLRGKVVEGVVHMERDSSALPTAASLLLQKTKMLTLRLQTLQHTYQEAGWKSRREVREGEDPTPSSKGVGFPPVPRRTSSFGT